MATTDHKLAPPQSSVDDVDTISSNSSHQDGVASNEGKVGAEEEKDRTGQILDKSQACVINKDDKWRPVIDASEKDVLLMPPPASFLRLSAGYKQLNMLTNFLSMLYL